jgi:hypothetical protein
VADELGIALGWAEGTGVGEYEGLPEGFIDGAKVVVFSIGGAKVGGVVGNRVYPLMKAW